MDLRKGLGWITGFLGVLAMVVFLFLVVQKYNPYQLSFNGYVAPKVGVIAGSIQPVLLKIEGLGLILPIIGATVDGNHWQTTDKGVSYLINSPIPGEIGNSIMYGHNWLSLLGNLKRIRAGETISVVMSDGSKRNFEVKFIEVVTPDETHILDQTDDNRLTLYTCTGFFDSKRLVVVAVKK